MADMHRSTARHLSRRHVLFGIALSGAGTILAACAPPPAPTATSAPQPTAAPAKPAEAPAKPTEAPAKPPEAPKPAAAGHLTALDDVYKELGPQNFAQLQKDAYVNWKGKIYGIPWYIETRILYYHKDLFEKAGVKAPTLWAEWVEAARKLTQGEQFGTLYSFEGPGAGQFWISLAQANGALVL